MERADLQQWRGREVARLLALVEAERRYYQEIVASVPVGLGVLAEDLTLLSANRTFRTVLDLPRGGLGRVRLADIFPDESVARRVSEVLESSNPQHDILVEAAVRGGSKPIRLAIQPFRGWDEEAVAEALLLVQDVVEAAPPPEERDRGTAEKEPAQDPAAELAESLDAILWERDAGTVEFTRVSGRPEAVLGFQARQLLADPHLFLERVHPGDRKWVETFYRNAAAASSSRSCEYRAVHAGGELVWLRDVVRARTKSQGAPHRLTGLTVDGSAQRKLGEQTAQTEKMAALSRLAGKLTHDCNNLLMIMSGYGEQVLSSLPAGHTAREDVEEILAASQRLSKVTSELLNFTRRPLLLPKVIDLNAVVEELEETLRRAAGDGVEVVLDRDPGLARVSADPEAIANSILRLIECSRDAMPGGGRITIRTANTEVRAGGPRPSGAAISGAYATISVSDTGPALDDETRTRLFEPFYSGPRAGPALPGVYSVVKNSGGDIAVSSGTEAGLVVTICLPAAEAPAGAPGTEVSAASTVLPVPEPRRMETVLVVDDEAGIRALMRKILQKQGYDVLEASHGEEALHLAAQHAAPIHLLLTDVVMPRMGGRELADHLRSARPDLKVLFVSGYSDEDISQHGPLPPDAAFLQKPFSLAALIEKTQTLLSGVDS